MEVCWFVLFLAFLSISIWLSGRAELFDDPRRFHKRLSLVSILCSLPFIICGSSFWIWAGYADDQLIYSIGDFVYKLGSPLTLIVINFPDYAGRCLTREDDVWAIPLVSLLFIFQWLIWGQLLAITTRVYRVWRDIVRWY